MKSSSCEIKTSRIQQKCKASIKCHIAETTSKPIRTAEDGLFIQFCKHIKSISFSKPHSDRFKQDGQMLAPHCLWIMYKFKSYEEQFILFTLLPYRFTSRLSKMCLCMFITFKFLFNVFCVRAKKVPIHKYFRFWGKWFWSVFNKYFLLMGI